MIILINFQAMYNTGMIAKFISSKVNKKNYVELLGSGTPKILFNDDFSEAILLLLRSSKKNSTYHKNNFPIFNVEYRKNISLKIF